VQVKDRLNQSIKIAERYEWAIRRSFGLVFARTLALSLLEHMLQNEKKAATNRDTYTA